jgi:2-polyprenyl-3-methyl-5-hydroxy-6-metoxy-1,4-benzoquinol methylase
MRGAARQDLEWVRCPVCDADRARTLFQKQGLTVVGCGNCQVRYVNPRPTAERLAALYQEEYFVAGSPDSSGAQHVQHGEMKLATARLRLRLLEGFCTKGRLVDVGCGGGFFVRTAGAAGWSAFGLEPSLRAARQAAHDQQDRIVAGRLEDAPFAAGRFDVVTMLDVLEHVHSPRSFLQAAHRLLMPSGVLLIETPNMAGLLPRLLGARHPWVRVEHLTHFTPDSLGMLLEQTGFHVQALYRQAPKVLTLDYLLPLTRSTNPMFTALIRRMVGWWGWLRRHPFNVPMDVLIAVAQAREHGRESTCASPLT